jgi:hypothetical protein
VAAVSVEAKYLSRANPDHIGTLIATWQQRVQMERYALQTTFTRVQLRDLEEDDDA